MINPHKPVEVYFNITKKVFSVKQNGRVVDRLDKLTLEGCTFKVSEKGRQKVLSTRRKNVHAVIRGYLTNVCYDYYPAYEVTYNPYKYSSFVYKSSKTEIQKAGWVRLSITEGIPRIEVQT